MYKIFLRIFFSFFSVFFWFFCLFFWFFLFFFWFFLIFSVYFSDFFCFFLIFSVFLSFIFLFIFLFLLFFSFIFILFSFFLFIFFCFFLIIVLFFLDPDLLGPYFQVVLNYASIFFENCSYLFLRIIFENNLLKLFWNNFEISCMEIIFKTIIQNCFNMTIFKLSKSPYRALLKG